MLSMETLALARAYADKIKQQVGAGFTPQIVESLPTVGSSTILYLVLKEGSAPQGNIYDEYLYINGAYEHIGDTSTAIVPDSELSSSSENPVQNKVITEALNGKQDILQFSEMPTASAEFEGRIIQYIGATTGSYKQGFFYKISSIATIYYWTAIDVSTDNTKLNKPDSSSVEQIITCQYGQTSTKEIEKTISSKSSDFSIPTSKAVYKLYSPLKESIDTLEDTVPFLENELKAEAALANYLLFVENYVDIERGFSIYQRKSEKKRSGNYYTARYLRYDFDYKIGEADPADPAYKNLTLKSILNGVGKTSITNGGFAFTGDSIVKLSSSLQLGSEELTFDDLLIDGFDGVSLYSGLQDNQKKTLLYSNAKSIRLRGLNTTKRFNGFSDWNFADGELVWSAACLRTARQDENDNKLIIDVSENSDALVKIYLPDGGTDGSGYDSNCYAFDVFGIAEDAGAKNLIATITTTLPFDVNSKVFEHKFYTTAQGLDKIRIFTSEF